jgi:hypothetical protein
MVVSLSASYPGRFIRWERFPSIHSMRCRMDPRAVLVSVEKNLLAVVGIKLKFLGCVAHNMVVEPTELSWLLHPVDKIFQTNFVFYSYLAGNIPRLQYRAQLDNEVSGKNLCLHCKSYETHQYTLWWNAELINIETDSTYGDCSVLKACGE